MTGPEAEITPAGAMETVLVVDDEVLLRIAICEYLRSCGFRVIEAAGAEEALIVLQAPGLKIDIVLSDAEMPGGIGGGFGLSQWCRVNRPGLPVILAGSPARAASAAADLCEAGPMLARPHEPEILLRRIKEMLTAARKSDEAAKKSR